MIFASIDKNGRSLGNYTGLWDEIKEQIELISGNKVIKYSQDFMKIKVLVCIIIVRSVFEENGKYYPQVLLHECFYEYKNNINPPVV